MSITAPYNFVPLNKEVFYPNWSNNGNEVSHDIPFKDGESGTIDITITAKTPIFIRNHYQDGDEYYELTKDNKTIKVSKEFCHYKNNDAGKEFYIPGSSMKGMIRSTLEILSFSKIRIDEETLQEPLSVRDMTNRNQLVGTAEGCGLLFLNEDGSAYIVDYGKPRTIESREIQKKYNRFNVKEEDIFKKYNLIKPHSKIMVNPYMKPLTNRDGKSIGNKKDARYSEEGEEGILVVNNYIGRKHHEFILVPSDIKKSEREVSVEAIKKFKNVYFTKGDTPTHKLGAFWKKQDKTHGIPIFYIEKNSQITDIGLTQLFKLSYNKTLLEAAKQDTDPTKLDLAETIFGTIRDEHALKGRVQFSHLKSATIKFELAQKSEILGSPNPTYYPNYIRQLHTKGDKVSKYTTLMDNNAQISGYKRYPLHSGILASVSSDKEKVKTHFKPLDTNTVFEGKVRFHNLKKAEIGALLSALTFHGNSSTNMHNIGMAKGLGYGNISVVLSLKSLNYAQEEYLQAFEREISTQIDNWKDTQQFKELIAMSSIYTKPQNELKYQLLENPNPKYELNKRFPEANDFTGAKKAKEYLLPHSSGTHALTQEKFEHSAPKLKQNLPQQKEIQKPKEYSIKEIAYETNTSVIEVLTFISTSTLPIAKNLTVESKLKEAQAKGLINKIKQLKEELK
jgi:CRISPR-associated protein (TIGR03986 family)